MKAIITGMNGTVAPVLTTQLAQNGYETVAWNRTAVPIDDNAATELFFDEQRPDWFFHVGMGGADWAENIARICAARDIKLLFTSTVSVFAPQQQAPLTPDITPLAEDDYGRYKRECEARMLAAYPNLIIARLAWQIGDAPGSNNMVDYLERQMRENGQIALNKNWYPASAFLPDTAAALVQLTTGYAPGIYHLDGNPGLSIYQIATSLKALQNRNWTITQTDETKFDNRMQDSRITVTPISDRFAI
jgi:dTDP-4-dehydrorhamnose reductase